MRLRPSTFPVALLATAVITTGVVVGAAPAAQAAAISGLTVVPLSSALGASGVRYDIQFTATSGLATPNDTVTITGPSGMTFPSDPTDYDLRDTTAGPTLTVAQHVNTGTNSVTIKTPFDVAAGHRFQVLAYDVTNPSVSGNVSVTTSNDTAQSVALSFSAPQAPQAVSITASSNAAGATGVRYTVSFHPSNTGALSTYNDVANANIGASTVTLTGPAGTVFPTDVTDYWFQDVTAGTPKTVESPSYHSPAGVATSNSGASVTLGVPEGLTTSTLIFPSDTIVVSAFDVTNASTVGGTTTFATSSDTVPSAPGVALVAAQSPQAVTISASSKAAGATGVRYTVSFHPSSSGGLSGYNAVANAHIGASTVTIKGPAGTVFPSGITNYWFQDVTAGTPKTLSSPSYHAPAGVTVSNSGATVTLGVPEGLTASDLIPSSDTVVVAAYGVTNSSTVGGTTTFSTSADTVASAPSAALVAMQHVNNVTATLSDSTGGATNVQYDVTFTTSSSGGLSGDNTVANAHVGAGTITLAAAAGTTFPSDFGDYTVQDVTAGTAAGGLCGSCSAAPPVAVSNGGATVAIAVPGDLTADGLIKAGDVVKVVATHVTNANTVSPITVSTSSDQGTQAGGKPAPTATNDTYATPANTPLTVAAPGVLANDTGPSGDPLTAAVVTSVTHGSLTLNVDGSFNFTPTAGYSGKDFFTYKVTDTTTHQTSSEATVTIVIDPTPPTTTVTSPTAPLQLTPIVRFCYGAHDPESGIASYDVRVASAAWNRGFGAVQYPPGWQHTKNTCEHVTGVPGHEYCFSMRSRNHAGLVSGWSLPWCRTLPLDDRALSAVTGGWHRSTGTHYYQHTITSTARAGQKLKLTGARAVHRLVLIVTRCPTCDVLDVFVNGVRHRLKTKGSSTRYEVSIFVPTTVMRTATIVVRTLHNRPVFIDGLAVIH